jgi:hypothetical protein
VTGMPDQTDKDSGTRIQKERGAFVWVEIPSRGGPVLVSPEQARVLRAIDKLRATLDAPGSKNKHG